MGRKSRAKSRGKEYGWMIELKYAGYPAGRYWFNTGNLVSRTPPKNASRMAYHTRAGGRYTIASSRPVSRTKED